MSIGKKRVYTNYFSDIFIVQNNPSLFEEFGHYYLENLFNLQEIYI